MKKSLIVFLVLAAFLIFFGFLNYAEASSHCPKTLCPAGKVCIQNPLCYETIEDLIKAIIRFLQTVALTVTALVIVLAGYFFVTSAGEPAKIAQARNMVIYALVGLLIILIAEGIIEVIEKVIKG